MKKLILFALLLSGCGPESRYAYRSGYVCSCEQREAVGRYVAGANLQAMGGSDPDDYVVSIYKVAVRTLCDHQDSVLTDGLAVGLRLKPCEVFYQDHTPIHP